MLRNFSKNQNHEGEVVSGSAAGTNAEGKACQHEPRQCEVKNCDYLAQKPKPKYVNPQWLCYEGSYDGSDISKVERVFDTETE